MLTPWIIQAIFWIGSLISFGFGILTILGALAMRGNGRGPAAGDVSLYGIVSGLAIMFLGPLFMRLYCEGMIIFFRIHEELCDLHTTMARKR